MKKALVLIILSILPALLFSEPEVSQKKEVAVLPSYSSYNIPDSAYTYFDDTLIAVLNNMKRFQVIGYQYRLDNNTAEKFIEKVREAKKQAALQNPQYTDADLGVAVIPASEMQKIANSFFVFIPSISGYNVTEQKISVEENKNGKLVINFETEYKAEVTISIKIISAEGNLLDNYYRRNEAKSRSSSIDAYNQAVSGALSGFEFYLRNMEEFKIKSGILKVEGGTAYLQLGKNIGVKPGYEFFIQKETTVLDRFKENVNTGLLRVNAIGEQWSSAATIFGEPQVGDQLVEAPMLGGRIAIFAGAAPMHVPDATIIVNYSYDNSIFSKTNNYQRSAYAFNAGLHGEYELGYAGLFDINAGILFDNPFAFNIDLGGSYEFYLGRFSITAGAYLSFLALIEPLGTLENNEDTLTINGTDFNDNIDISMNGINFGIKPNISINYQFDQNFKIRLTAGYAYYFISSYYLNLTSSSDSKTSTTVNLSDSSVNISMNGSRIDSLPFNFDGFFGGLEFVFRF